MAVAYIYDAVRTPRGRGKADGALHEVSSLGLANTALTAIRERNHLAGPEVDDVILGCVDPVGEAGGDIARARRHPVRGLLQRPVRRAHAGHHRDVRQPAVSERCRRDFSATRPFAAVARRSSRHRNV